jgi:hypothetical protein
VFHSDYPRSGSTRVAPLMWDEQYAPFIRRVGFLPLAQLVTDGLSMMDSAALMALVDWWRSETHTFHLPCGETTVMLQDVTMILGLPIDGTLICGPMSSVGWRDSVGEAIGIQPPMSSQIRRTRRRWVCTLGGSHLTSTPTRRVLRMQSFRGMTGLVFGIWMTSDHF